MIPCDASHPYFDGKNCIDCAINRNITDIANHKPYFNLKTKTCQNCYQYDNNTHKCTNESAPVTPVTPVAPKVCPEGYVLNNATSKCERLVSNVASLAANSLI